MLQVLQGQFCIHSPNHPPRPPTHNKKSQTTPARAISLNPGLRDISHSITGGSLLAQGYWLPYDAARAVAANFCWHLRAALTPLFGPDFVRDCLHPADALYATFRIPRTVVQRCRAQAEEWQRKRNKRVNGGGVEREGENREQRERENRGWVRSGGGCDDNGDGNNSPGGSGAGRHRRRGPALLLAAPVSRSRTGSPLRSVATMTTTGGGKGASTSSSWMPPPPPSTPGPRSLRPRLVAAAPPTPSTPSPQQHQQQQREQPNGRHYDNFDGGTTTTATTTTFSGKWPSPSFTIESGYASDTERPGMYLCSPQVSPLTQVPAPPQWASVNNGGGGAAAALAPAADVNGFVKVGDRSLYVYDSRVPAASPVNARVAGASYYRGPTSSPVGEASSSWMSFVPRSFVPVSATEEEVVVVGEQQTRAAAKRPISTVEKEGDDDDDDNDDETVSVWSSHVQRSSASPASESPEESSTPDVTAAKLLLNLLKGEGGRKALTSHREKRLRRASH